MQKIFNPKAIKALAVDLDGTSLLPDNSMGERTVQCFKRLLSQGLQVIICTGRAVESSSPFFSTIGASGPMVFFNGAEIVNIPDLKLIKSSFLNIETVDYGIDLARSTGTHFQVFLSPFDSARLQPQRNSHWELLLAEKYTPEAEMYNKHTGINYMITDIKKVIAQHGLNGVVKAMFIAEKNKIHEIRQKLTERFGSSIYTANTFPMFLEIMNAGVSKGEGLKTVMDCRGLKKEEIIAFGDEENDLPLFEAAGFCASPSNARENVRDAADFIFGPNTEESLATFLEKSF